MPYVVTYLNEAKLLIAKGISQFVWHLKKIQLGFVIYVTPMPYMMISFTFSIVPTLYEIDRNTLTRIYERQNIINFQKSNDNFHEENNANI